MNDILTATFSAPNDPGVAVAPSSLQVGDPQVLHAAPISQLGYDVLGHIIMFNTYLDFKNPHAPSQTTRRTSQVCRRWRELALNYPTLWASCIDFADPLVWIKEMVVRSGSVPITDLILPSLTPHLMNQEYSAYMRGTSGQHALHSIPEFLHLLTSSRVETSKIELAMSLIQRSQRIYIKINKTDWSHVVANVVHRSPNLEHFALNIQRSREDDDQILPQDIFAGVAPKLTTLELQGCGCHFQNPVFHNLTKLVVRKPFVKTLPSAGSWLAILKNMQKLQRLELTRCFNESAAPAQSNPDVTPLDIRLPHLESLTLVGNTAPCSTLFTRLQIPSSCTMVVKCHRVLMDDAFVSMISFVQEKLAFWKNDNERTFISFKSSSTSLGFHKKYTDPNQTQEFIYSFDWFSDHTMPSLAPIFPSVVAALKMAASETPELRVNFHHSDFLDNTRTAELLGAFEKVEDLSILMSDTLFWFLSAVDAPGLRGATLLPALRSIDLQHILFGETPAPNGEDLIKFVGGRPDIRRIGFDNCTPILYITMKLEELGVDVVDSTKRAVHKGI